MDITEIQSVGRYPKLVGLRVSALIEIAVFFLLAMASAYFFHINYNGLSPHPFAIVVILMAVQYGTKEALLAAVLSTIFFLLGQFPQQNVLQDRFDYFFVLAKAPILWFVTAVILGEIRMRHIRERDQLKEAALEIVEKEKAIAESYNDLKKMKESLEHRVVSEMKTALMAYEAFKKLEGFDNPEEMIKGALDLVRTLLLPQKFSLYLLKDNQLKQIASEGWAPGDSYTMSFGADTLLFQEIMGKHRVLSVINVDDFRILEKEGVLAVPIMQEGRVFGMIKVEEIPFTHLRMTTVQTLQAIGEWLGAAFAGRKLL